VDTRQKPIPIVGQDVDESAAQLAELHPTPVGATETARSVGDYVANHREEFVARFRGAQQAFSSRDPQRIRQIGGKARQSEAEAIVADFPS
jgi:hypothetical protein